MTRRYLMRLLRVSRGEHHLCGQYVISYDPDPHLPDGSYDGGIFKCTPDAMKAGRFTEEEFRALFHASPRCACHRLRPDGKPNRPLTAFDIEGIPVEEMN